MRKQIEEKLNDEQKHFTCKRTEMAAHLVARRFIIGLIELEDDSSFSVYWFLASPELYKAILNYTSVKAGERYKH